MHNQERALLYDVKMREHSGLGVSTNYILPVASLAELRKNNDVWLWRQQIYELSTALSYKQVN